MSVPFRKRFRRELRVRALFLALPLLRVLPLWAGAALGRLAWYSVPRQRRLAREHLAIAFPEKSESERTRIGKESFANLALSALEAMRADRLEIERVVELSPDDEALLRKAHAQGKGVVVVTGHIGAWELFARRIAALGIPCGTVAKEAHDPRITRLLDQSRRRAGVRVFWRGAPLSARELLRFLRDQRGILGLLIDQDTRVSGHFVSFFGRPAFTPRAAGDLAVHLGAPLLVGCAHRLARGMHRIALRTIEVERTGDRDADSLALTAAATGALESEIRANPAEWVWMHPRWQTQIPEIAREK
ncbi:MAG TPA: lipid A biosynthesis acyltransferase [Myxococcales bacterium]|nr:lipid A biosynthesis acyltransferase [Myxococcales bacterium]